MQVSSDSLGSYLRDEREQRGVSLQDISAMTKIQVKFLHALEEDAYDQLPATPFVVGFLRAYAQCLCLDANEIVAAYHQYYRVQDNPENSQLLPTPPIRQRARVVGAGAVVIVLGLIAVLMLREMRSGLQPRRSSSIPVTTGDQVAATGSSASAPVLSAPVASRADVKVPVPEPAQASLAVSLASPPEASTLSPLPPQAAAGVPETPLPTTSEASPPPLVLQADAVEDTWLRVVIDGKERYALLLKAGKSIHWQAGERFALTVGNVRGTHLLLNGQEVALPSVPNNVVRDFLLTRALLN